MVAACATGGRRRHGVGLDLALALSVARTSIVCEPGPDAAASQAYVHWTQVAPEIGVESLALPPLPVDRDLDLRDAAVRRPRDAGDCDPASGHARPGARDVDPRLRQDRASPSTSRANPVAVEALPRRRSSSATLVADT